ncbi:MAG TPA: ribonuclease Z [Solirubrobacteraceae bacterium]|nr:ribonuclease Z [Solirubrobacteraceae bacterium]
MDLSVVFAGTAGSVPTARRGLPATLVRRGGDRILFDCGEGTQRQLIRTVGLPEIDDVYVTHLHLDHWLGLPGLITSFSLRGRTRPLSVFGPPGVRAALGRLGLTGRLGYELTVEELDRFEEVEYDGYTVGTIPVRHRGPVAYGYVLAEDPRPGRFDAALAEARGVTPGPDFGRLQRGEIVNGVRPEEVIGEERPGRRVVLSGDTAPCDAVRLAAHRADLLIHDGTFTDDELDRALETKHSTARQAAEIAVEAEVRMLALTHLSTRYGGGEIKREARAVFENTVVPRDGDVIEVPFPEKGPPELVRADRAASPPEPLLPS